MDNSQFRALVASSSIPRPNGATAQAAPSSTPASLGSRARSSIPMTPRSLGGYNAASDLRRQVTDFQHGGGMEPPLKRFKSTAAPKGTKYSAGYTDRAKVRQEQDVEDDKAKRFKAIEEMYKLQQIDQATFENLRREIGVGGDISSTHLVKGLDRDLLEKARRGDDLEGGKKADTQQAQHSADIDVDVELESALLAEVSATPRDLPRIQEPAPDKLSRDQILTKLREDRLKIAAEATAAAQPTLGDRFKNTSQVVQDKPSKERFTEIVEGRRREVLVITDKEGNVKRKTRWIDKEPLPGNLPHIEEQEARKAAPKERKMKEAVNTPAPAMLGMEVPAEVVAKQRALLEQARKDEDDDDDIFAGTAEYDPLAGIDGSDVDDESDEGEVTASAGREDPVHSTRPNGGKRSYFSTEIEPSTEEKIGQDPSILAAIKRAAAIRQEDEKTGDEKGRGREYDPLSGSSSAQHTTSKEGALLEKLKKRDLDDSRDLDLGFGESRFGDEDDEDGPLYDGEGKSSARKRGPKKHKGDKNNLQDVMSALAGRRNGKPKE